LKKTWIKYENFFEIEIQQTRLFQGKKVESNNVYAINKKVERKYRYAVTSRVSIY